MVRVGKSTRRMRFSLYTGSYTSTSPYFSWISLLVPIEVSGVSVVARGSTMGSCCSCGETHADMGKLLDFCFSFHVGDLVEGAFIVARQVEGCFHNPLTACCGAEAAYKDKDDVKPAVVEVSVNLAQRTLLRYSDVFLLDGRGKLEGNLAG